MAVTPIGAINPPPLSTDTPADFRTKAFAWVDGMVDLHADLNVSIGEFNADFITVESNKVDAEAAAAAAASSAGASEWSAGAITEGDVRWSPINHRTYRATSTFTSSIDPKNDPANWVDVNGLAAVVTEGYDTVTSSSNMVVIDCSLGNVFTHILTEATQLSFINFPTSGTAQGITIEIIQDAGASGYTVSWAAPVKFAGGIDPLLSLTANAMDIVTFYSRDAGANVRGFMAAQDSK